MAFAANVAPIEALRERYHRGASPIAELEHCLAHANSNASHNVYLAQDQAWSRVEAEALPPGVHHERPFNGVPVSLKDCFDLAGFPTSCGSKFYLERNGIAHEDSALAAKLRAIGAVITGKTHLHQLAYGITGENRDFGDCLQPRDKRLLTAGSSSGGAASVQEGSALAAIGTDTGGSIRVPAALCGLAGFRASIDTGAHLWSGGAHLAPTFDTLGWLYRDLRDGPLLAQSLFDLEAVAAPRTDTLHIGVPDDAFLHDCDDDVRRTHDAWTEWFAQQGAHLIPFHTKYWDDSFAIFSAIQASEAAAIHRGNFEHFEDTIAERLAWGASITADELAALHERKQIFEQQTAELFTNVQFLLLPCTPVSALYAHDDHSRTRARILRYTAPISLAGLPAVTLPALLEDTNVGVQLVAPVGNDASLIALSAAVGELAIR
jgi:Asp-tRNA(Asn)/Glu-tRNA(Gln) amidotransferase A subunit family amidase